MNRIILGKDRKVKKAYTVAEVEHYIRRALFAGELFGRATTGNAIRKAMGDKPMVIPGGETFEQMADDHLKQEGFPNILKKSRKKLHKL